MSTSEPIVLWTSKDGECSVRIRKDPDGEDVVEAIGMAPAFEHLLYRACISSLASKNAKLQRIADRLLEINGRLEVLGRGLGEDLAVARAHFVQVSAERDRLRDVIRDALAEGVTT